MKNQRITFVGSIECNTDPEAKVPFIREISKDTTEGLSLNLQVVAAQNNRAYIEMPGFVNKSLRLWNSDGNEFNIDWNDRFDKEIVDKVASYCKNVITLNGERHEFISAYDFIKYVRENIDKIKGKRFTATGRIRKNVYQGKITDRYELQNLFEVKEDDERKNQLRVTSEIYFNRDSFDLADWRTEKKIYINCYTQENIDKDNKAVFVDKQLVFDCSKIDFNNEKHLNILKYELNQIGCDYVDDKIKINLKKGYHHIIAITNLQNGAEEIEFDENELTPNQKKAIELGYKTLNDFKPSGNIYGDKVTIYKLVDFDLKTFSDGCKECKDIDVEENIYDVCLNQSYSKEINFTQSINPPSSNQDDLKDDDEDFDLFG